MKKTNHQTFTFGYGDKLKQTKPRPLCKIKRFNTNQEALIFKFHIYPYFNAKEQKEVLFLNSKIVERCKREKEVRYENYLNDTIKKAKKLFHCNFRELKQRKIHVSLCMTEILDLIKNVLDENNRKFKAKEISEAEHYLREIYYKRTFANKLDFTQVAIKKTHIAFYDVKSILKYVPYFRCMTLKKLSTYHTKEFFNFPLIPTIIELDLQNLQINLYESYLADFLYKNEIILKLKITECTIKLTEEKGYGLDSLTYAKNLEELVFKKNSLIVVKENLKFIETESFLKGISFLKKLKILNLEFKEIKGFTYNKVISPNNKMDTLILKTEQPGMISKPTRVSLKIPLEFSTPVFNYENILTSYPNLTYLKLYTIMTMQKFETLIPLLEKHKSLKKVILLNHYVLPVNSKLIQKLQQLCKVNTKLSLEIINLTSAKSEKSKEISEMVHRNLGDRVKITSEGKAKRIKKKRKY